MDGWMDGSSIVGSLVQTTVINVIGMLNATAQVRRRRRRRWCLRRYKKLALNVVVQQRMLLFKGREERERGDL